MSPGVFTAPAVREALGEDTTKPAHRRTNERDEGRPHFRAAPRGAPRRPFGSRFVQIRVAHRPPLRKKAAPRAGHFWKTREVMGVPFGGSGRREEGTERA